VTSACRLLAPETVHLVDTCRGALVLGLQARGDEVPVARLLGLVGHEVERTLAVALRGEAAVAVAAAALLELLEMSIFDIP
jgi:hypothetical protein